MDFNLIVDAILSGLLSGLSKFSSHLQPLSLSNRTRIGKAMRLILHCLINNKNDGIQPMERIIFLW